MKNIVLILLFMIACRFCLHGQNYLRGVVMTEHRQRLPSVKINAVTAKLVYKTDMYGNFGFSSLLEQDTLIFSCDGYDSAALLVKSGEYARVTLKSLPSSVVFTRENIPLSVNIKEAAGAERSIRSETYTHTSGYGFIETAVSPGIAFSANINRASYSNVRRLINEMEYLLPPHAVRIEEMLNYFNFSYTEPSGDSMFHCSSWLTSCPWNKNNRLFFINSSARKIDMRRLPPANLVFLIDVSGSMDMPNKLPLIKAGLIKMFKSLRAEDSISIVTFGANVNILLEGVSGSNKTIITKAVEKIVADGNTPGEAGIRTAFKVAGRRFIKGGNNRIILAADGDFNVGLSSEKELLSLMEQERQSGIYLTCLGVGSGNYKDSKLVALAQKGRGNFAYIDNEQEAERVLVTNLTKTLFTVAEDVHITVNFDSSAIKSYRLLGYENDNMVSSDSVMKLKGGEIGSGHSLMAVFEIEPGAGNSTHVADLNVHYRLPMQAAEHLIPYQCSNNVVPIRNADSSLQKAACVVMLGIKLKDSEYSALVSWKQLQKLAAACFEKDKFLDREFLMLVSKAKKMYTHRKKYGGE